MRHRHSLSDWLRQAAVLFCGLLLLNLSSAWAASAKPSTKKTVATKVAKKGSSKAIAGKPGRKPARSVAHGSKVRGRNKHAKDSGRDWPAPEVMTAEVVESDASGLHGAASFYGNGFQGRRTATGEIFNVREFTAASNHFPLGTKVAVRRLDNNRCAIVKVNDRMHARHKRRIIDVSRGVAEYLDMIRNGVVLVRVAALKNDQVSTGSGACMSAFEDETPCPDCSQLQMLPTIGSETLQ